MYNIAIQHLCTLWNDHLNKFITPMIPYIVITLLLIIFPMLYFTFLWLFITADLCILIPSPFSLALPTLLPFGNHQFVLWWLSFFLLCSFIYLFLLILRGERERTKHRLVVPPIHTFIGSPRMCPDWVWNLKSQPWVRTWCSNQLNCLARAFVHL